MGVVGDYVSRNTDVNVGHMGMETFPEKRDLQRNMEESYAKRMENISQWQEKKSRNYQNNLIRGATAPIAAAAQVPIPVAGPRRVDAGFNIPQITSSNRVGVIPNTSALRNFLRQKRAAFQEDDEVIRRIKREEEIFFNNFIRKIVKN